MAGLKPAYGGSIPSFLVKKRVVGLEQMLVLRRCDREEDNHVIILHLYVEVQRIILLVLRQMLLK